MRVVIQRQLFVFIWSFEQDKAPTTFRRYRLLHGTLIEFFLIVDFYKKHLETTN